MQTIDHRPQTKDQRSKGSRDITDWQKKRIHVLAARLGIYDKADDTLYRDMLEARTGVRTCLDLSYAAAQDLINQLEDEAQNAGIWKRPRWTSETGRRKYEHLGYRMGMANPAQLRMIDAMWKDVSYQKTDEEKERAFNRFLLSHFHIAAIEWVEDWMVRKIVETIEAMRRSGSGKLRYRKISKRQGAAT